MMSDGLDEVLMRGHSQRVGRFRLLFDGERWEWSDAVARMHGYQPGEVTPTTELLLSHKHPDDRDNVAQTLRRVLHDGEPFSSRHRIVDTANTVHFVVVVGERLLDSTGKQIGTAGFYIDVTDAHNTDIQASFGENLAEVVATRAVIEQAKGALMLMYGIDAERAFDVLTWRSQEANLKVRAIAEALLAEIATAVDMPPRVRDRFDHIFLTAGNEPTRGLQPGPSVAARLSPQNGGGPSRTKGRRLGAYNDVGRE